MKKYEIRIVIEVTDDVRRDQIQVFDHDVCDGLEVLLVHPNNTNEFKLKSFAMTELIELKSNTNKHSLNITNDDILEVAKKLEITLTGNQINWVKLSYADTMRQDPAAIRDSVLEDLIYCIKNNFEG